MSFEPAKKPPQDYYPPQVNFAGVAQNQFIPQTAQEQTVQVSGVGVTVDIPFDPTSVSPYFAKQLLPKDEELEAKYLIPRAKFEIERCISMEVDNFKSYGDKMSKVEFLIGTMCHFDELILKYKSEMKIRGKIYSSEEKKNFITTPTISLNSAQLGWLILARPGEICSISRKMAYPQMSILTTSSKLRMGL